MLIQNLQFYWALKEDKEEVSRIQIVQLVSFLTRSVQHWRIRSVSHLCRCKRHDSDVDILIVHLYCCYIRSSCPIRMLKSPKVTVLHKEHCRTGPYILRCIYTSASWTNIFHTSLSFRKIKRKRTGTVIKNSYRRSYSLKGFEGLRLVSRIRIYKNEDITKIFRTTIMIKLCNEEFNNLDSLLIFATVIISRGMR